MNLILHAIPSPLYFINLDLELSLLTAHPPSYICTFDWTASTFKSHLHSHSWLCFEIWGLPWNAGSGMQCKERGSVLLLKRRRYAGKVFSGKWMTWIFSCKITRGSDFWVNEFLDLASNNGAHEVISRCEPMSAFRRNNILNINNSRAWTRPITLAGTSFSQFQAPMTLVTDAPTSKASQTDPHRKTVNLDRLAADSKMTMNPVGSDVRPKLPESHKTMATASTSSNAPTNDLPCILFKYNDARSDIREQGTPETLAPSVRATVESLEHWHLG